MQHPDDIRLPLCPLRPAWNSYTIKLSTVGSRAFASATHHLWNGLPIDVISADSMLNFRRLLKRFWATVCTTVRPPPIGPLSCLSGTLVYCGQTVEWIKMPLGMEVGLD